MPLLKKFPEIRKLKLYFRKKVPLFLYRLDEIMLIILKFQEFFSHGSGICDWGKSSKPKLMIWCPFYESEMHPKKACITFHFRPKASPMKQKLELIHTAFYSPPYTHQLSFSQDLKTILASPCMSLTPFWFSACSGYISFVILLCFSTSRTFQTLSPIHQHSLRRFSDRKA